MSDNLRLNKVSISFGAEVWILVKAMLRKGIVTTIRAEYDDHIGRDIRICARIKYTINLVSRDNTERDEDFYREHDEVFPSKEKALEYIGFRDE